MLKRFKKAFLLAGTTSVIVMALVFAIVKAGSLTPPGSVSSTMHSLLEIYNSIAGDDITFTGSGLNDMVFGGTFTGAASTHYRIQIDAAGTPDTFKWSDDGGATWDQTAVAITGLAQPLNNGITITFGATTGHTLNDRWDFYRQVADEDGNIAEQLKYISGMALQQIYNNSASPEISGNKATTLLTLKQSGAGNIFELQNAAAPVFTVDNLGNISNVLKISSAAGGDLELEGATGIIKAATGSAFYNEGGYAIAASGEEILRASIPIFAYDFPARTAASAIISREITLDASSFPAVPAGANRIYKFKIQYANNLAVGDSSWQIINVTNPLDVYAPFTVPNTAIANLDESSLYYTSPIAALPAIGDQWHLQLTALAGVTIQIYQIELLAYDVLQ